MSKRIQTLLAVAVTGVAFSAAAQQGVEHTQHHPAAAPTPAECHALMADHPQAMHEGMDRVMQRMPIAAPN
ncbi:hypothetical protein [Hydrogenophaga sp. ZJX-1]|uniref:hypothetical protein n=1 Tax=Hydrogenophaga sp. ZJX-1 TaxID=3404778 RepID=UPI003B28382D